MAMNNIGCGDKTARDLSDFWLFSESSSCLQQHLPLSHSLLKKHWSLWSALWNLDMVMIAPSETVREAGEEPGSSPGPVILVALRELSPLPSFIWAHLLLVTTCYFSWP